METLVNARPHIITLFFISLVIFGVGLFQNTELVFYAGVIIAHIALFLFLLTESFGSAIKERSMASIILARVFLIFTGLVVASMLANLIMVALS